jgi:MFS family permease
MLQDLAPSALRGRFTALFGVVSVIGIAIGPPLVGAISDRLGGRADALLLASVGVAVTGLAIAGGCFVLARKPFLATIAHARAIDAAGQPAEERP